MKVIKKNRLLVVILLVSLFFMAYRATARFMYGHDQDLIGWIIRDVLERGHLRLIGQETSTTGIYIGPIYYYFLVPFYLVFGMSPIGGVVSSIIIGVLTTVCFWWVFTKMFGKEEGYIAGIFHGGNYFLSNIEREVNPTQPIVFGWSVLFLYSLHLLRKGEKWGYILAGVLVGLIWHINMTLVVLTPLIPLVMIYSKKKIEWRNVLLGLGIVILLNLPLIAFEARHGFLQTNALITSLTSDQGAAATGLYRFERTFLFASRNVERMLFPIINIKPMLVSFGLLGVFGYLVKAKKIDRFLGKVMGYWLVIYIVFFGLYSKALSEYYLNGLTVFWVVIVVLGAVALVSKRKKLGHALLAVYLGINFYGLFTHPENNSGYVHRKRVVEYIKQDASKHGYPCVAVSYITDPGYELGYRYLFWMEGMHVNRPKSESPVYSIVFPHSKVSGFDEAFGALAVINPDYDKYASDQVEISCSGENDNETEPMFGYTGR